MMSKRAKRELLDKLHRGYVWTMIGITGVGLVCIGQVFYGIITAAKQKEKLMLAEIADKEDPEEFPQNTRMQSIYPR